MFESEKDNISVWHAILKEVGKAENDFVQDHSEYDLRYTIDTMKMCEKLNWTLKYIDFETGQSDMIQGILISKVGGK